ncbi:class I tRNA ligase family protein, partial [bacterium]|nr:class I tRNA ligase family protein [bacterium]
MENKELPKAYDFKKIESDIYKEWEKSGFFNPDNLAVKKTAKPFSISMPPPNLTGVPHLGTALGLALQDIMMRFHRQKQEKTLWVPGSDHAAIATQSVVEKKLKKQGLNRYDLGKEKLLEKIDEHINEVRPIMRQQIKKIGASCDWSREAYTMDENLSKAVNEVFIKMCKDGLIYRGERIVNWCPRC